MIDENEFFRHITLKLCGNLDIEEGLHACIQYLAQHMPADYICLEKYEEDLGAMRFIAWADMNTGEPSDFLVPMTPNSNCKMSQDIKSHLAHPQPAFVINNSDEEPVTKELVEALGYPQASIMGNMLVVGGQLAGEVILAAGGVNQFTEHHAHLFGILREPFFVAMTNALRHREVLKLKDMLSDDNRYLHRELQRMVGDQIVGTNFGLKKVMSRVEQVAGRNSPVLILGDTGTGKDMIANAIHQSSPRADKPFVSINCGAIPESLIDSELFGHEKGAFTGALSQKRGRFERAHTGTIFLDEIGELPPQVQVRLLRVLQSKEIERVGGTDTIALDIRVIAATNRNLEEMVKNGTFREDLWFRLNVFPILVPPLRQRTSDIPSLVQHFIERKAKELKIVELPSLADGAIDTLMQYDWPGNVRELENIIERAMILHSGQPLQFEELCMTPDEPACVATGAPEDHPMELDALIKQHIQHVLELTGGKIHGPGGAGEVLGVNPDTLRYRMKKLGIQFLRKGGK